MASALELGPVPDDLRLIVTSQPADTGLLSLNQIAAMVMARRRLVLGTALGLMLLTLAIVLVLPRTWVSSSDVYIDYRDNDPIAGRSFSAMLDASYMQTQIEMLRSHVVADAVIASQGLRRTEAYKEAAASDGEARANSALIESIAKNIEIETSGDSRVIEVGYAGRSPEEARDLANAIVAAYIEVSQNIAFNAARSLSEQYNLQLEQLRNEADAIQGKLTQFQQKTGILSVDEREDLGTRQLNELITQLALLQNRRQEAEADNAVTARLIESGARIEELPEIAQLPGINDLKSKLSDVNRRLADAQAIYGARHPTVLGLQQERGGLQARISAEARAARNRNENEAERLKEQEAALDKAIAAQRASVLEQKANRDQIVSYQRQLASVQQIYNTALQKYDGLLMASNISTPNITVLRAAELPIAPDRPKKLQSLIASVIAGGVIGLLLALALELRQRRVRCPDDMERPGGPALIGRIGFAGRPLGEPSL